MKKLFNLFAAMLVALVANAAVININTGTSDALRKAVASAGSGDVIVMAAGTYIESNSDYIAFHGKDVTVMAENGAEVIVQPKVPIRLKTGGVARFYNIKFDCGHLSDLASYSEIIVPADGTTGKKVFLEGCEFFGWKQKSTAIIHTRSDRQLDSIVINNCYFHDNLYNCISLKYASIEGLEITNSTFANITTDANAPSLGVIDVQATTGSVLIDHCTFYNCEVKNIDYGAVKVPTNISPIVSNCIFMMPEEYAGGRAVYNTNGEVKNCLTYNYTNDAMTGIYSGPTITACIQSDPMFVDAANADYRIQGGSPVLGTGSEGSDIGDPRWIPKMEYYMVGDITQWEVQPGYKLSVNPANEAEYMISMTLYAGNAFKIVKSDGLSIADTDWYPTGVNNNYEVTRSGDYTIYFRPDGQGGDGWHYGYIYTEAADLGPWETWFGNADWQEETLSYLSYDPNTQKAEVYILQGKYGQWQAQVKYHGIHAEDGKCYHVALKMLANKDVTGITLKWQDDNNLPNVIYENQSVNIAASEEFAYDKVVTGVVGEQGSNGILILDFGYAQEGTVIQIYDVVIEETECPEPPTYYLVGSMTEWAATDEYMFVENPELAGEYTVNATLETDMSIKVVGVSGEDETWYPAGIGKEYVVDAAHAGEKTVYFRPAGNPDWAEFGGYFFINVTLDVDNVSADTRTAKVIRNGQLLIRRGDDVYNTLGQEIK
ncbi:MAG: DUF5123 domain-containing protein [Paludibacteraceae bacterium]|nr:DUF5123 domain-containing protein [Paludibacteraceae bacterium]